MKGSTVILAALLLASTVVQFAIVGGQLLPTFVIGFSPTSLSVQQAEKGSVHITVTSTGDWSKPVSLSFTDVPIGVSISFDNNPVQPPPGSAVQSVATFSVDPSVPVGSHAMMLVGSSGSDVRKYDFNLQVTPQPLPGDFGISVSPQSISTQRGGSGSAIVKVTSIKRFSNPISLSSSGAPSGVTVNFSPSQITPASGGSASARVSVSVASYAQSGFYPITLTGSSFSGPLAVMIQHSTQLNVRVSSPQDFTITINPSSISIQQGESTTATVIVSSVGGFSSPVGLSASNGVPSGVQVSFSPNPITPGSSTMSINVASSATTGKFSFQVLGSSGSLNHATTFSMTISQAAQPSFSISASSTSLSVSQGGAGSVTILIASINDFTSPVNVYATWVGQAPSGITISGPGTLTPPADGTTSGQLILSATSTASVGNYLLSVVGTSGSLNSITLTVTINEAETSDFTIAASPTTISLTQGSAANSIITVLSQNSFNSPVALSVSWQGSTPSGVPYTLPSPVTPQPNTVATSTLSLNALAGSSVGTYTLLITGSSGSLAHSVPVTVQISGSSVTTVTTGTTDTSTAPATKCLIATATFGSELTPEVRFLRTLRDQQIMNTFAGRNFMIAFNAWYYSFSPTVAQSITQHATLQGGMRIALHPLIEILRLGVAPFSLLPAHQEFAAVISGLLISTLIGLTYLAIPTAGILNCTARLRRIAREMEKSLVVILAVSLLGIAIAESSTSQLLVIVSSVTTILSTITLSTLLTAQVLVHIIKGRTHQ